MFLLHNTIMTQIIEHCSLFCIVALPYFHSYQTLYNLLCMLFLRYVQVIVEMLLQVRNKQMEVEVFYELLQNLRQELGFSNLTSHSQQLFMLDHSNWRTFVDQYKDIPLKKQV